MATSTDTWRDGRARRRAEDRRARWHFDRAVARVERAADAIRPIRKQFRTRHVVVEHLPR